MLLNKDTINDFYNYADANDKDYTEEGHSLHATDTKIDGDDNETVRN